MENSSDSVCQTLLQITNNLVREVTPDALFHSLAKNLQTIVATDRCSLTIYDSESNALSWFSTASGIPVSRMDSPTAPLRGPLARTAILEGIPLIIPRLEEYAHDPAIQLMLDAGLRSSIALPLLSRNKAIGALVVSFIRYLRENDTDLVGLLEKISTQVSLAVDNMLVHAKLNQKNTTLSQQMGALLRTDDPQHAESRFFYECSSMQHLIKQIRLLAHRDAPVLICGETGTGKEYLARFIHRHSKRREHNFVKVNCPALSPTLFESELFGHARGAYTGASSSRVGRFELADNGSIFLDEIGELEMMLQAKILHVLQDAKFERVGESRSISIDARCISATNADLHQMIREGRFRRDLFYRLGVTTVQVPSLRDREGETASLARHILNIHARDMQCSVPSLHPEALRMLAGYHWPGNVRELSNLLARLLILHPGVEIGPEHILPLLEQSQHRVNQKEPVGGYRSPIYPPVGQAEHHHSASGADALALVEKQHIERMLAQTGGRVSGKQGAASLLRIPRSTLQYKLKKHGINPKVYGRNKATM